MEKFANLPAPAKWGAGAAGGGALLALGTLVGSAKGLLILLGSLAVLAGLAIAVFKLWTSFRDKKRSRALEGDMRSGSAATPRGVSRPEKLAKLEELRSRFEEGVDHFRARGKDIYRLPWYVFVGPPGSGKTEAIRHSGISFPSNMQDPLQGVGGTINMHWWFSNQAVILDTAGRLLFEEVPAGETGEWKEFLKLLRKSRPHCPINGLFLTISVDSLIKETANQIQDRAGKIAQQLDVIQRTLDVRFPVYVIVTKCDLLRGFREFFENLTDPQLQHQIVGWSNPDPLDAAFRPEATDQFIKSVVQRLQRRRLGLLRDPVAEDPANRRTDEVDALYALPESLELIASRLRSYLETIFVSGEWSAKPVFLRGIYFTSALREGKELDLALAEVLGKPVDELPEGKAWGRERSYFLRDLFVEKSFKEKGLVTRATNAGAMLRRRKLVLGGAGLTALLCAGFFLWAGNRQLRTSIGEQVEYWKRATEDWKEVDGQALWLPIVDESAGQYAYLGDQSVTAFKEGQYPLLSGVTRAEYHARLEHYATNTLRLGVFKPVSFLLRGINLGRRSEAQQAVFEAGVIAPLVHFSRQKLTRDPGGDAAHLDRQARALAALIALELGHAGRDHPPLTTTNSAMFLAPLLGYLLETNVPAAALDTNLSHTMARVYSPSREAAWPPAWLSAGRSLSNNPAISNGLERFVAITRSNLVAANKELDQIKSLRAGLGALRAAEDKLLEALRSGDDSRIRAAFDALQGPLTSFETQLKQARAAGGVLETSPFSLSHAYSNLLATSGAGFSNAFHLIQQTVAPPPGGSTNLAPLAAEIDQRIRREQSTMAEQASLKPQEAVELAALDADYLAREASGSHVYAARADVYRKLADLLANKGPLGQVIFGRIVDPLDERRAAFNALQDRLGKYEGGRKQEFAAAGSGFLTQAWQRDVAAYLDSYARLAQAELQRFQRFPLARPSGTAEPLTREQIVQAGKFLAAARADLANTNLAALAGAAAASLSPISGRVETSHTILRALLDDSGNLLKCRIKLRATPGESWTGYWPVIGVGDGSKDRTDRPGDRALGEFDLDADFTLKLFKSVDDAAPDQNFAARKWGVLRLLLEKPVEGGGKNWVVRVPVGEFSGNPGRDPYRSAAVTLVLEFDQPLPAPKQWP
jgi:hypothetical protein